MARTNAVAREWRKVLKDQLGNNMLMDSPKGKTAFACGICFVLQWLEKQGKYPAELDVIYDDVAAFTDAYMAEGARNRARMQELQDRFPDIPWGGPPPGGPGAG